MNPTRIALAGLLAVSGLAACSDDDRRTQEAFVSDVNEVCARHIETRSELASQHFSDDQPPTVEQLQAFYADFAPEYAGTAEELREIEPSEQLAETWAAYLEARERNAGLLTEAAEDTAVVQRLLDTDEAELREGEELASELGINEEC